MNRRFVSIPAVFIAFFAVACGEDAGSTETDNTQVSPSPSGATPAPGSVTGPTGSAGAGADGAGAPVAATGGAPAPAGQAPAGATSAGQTPVGQTPAPAGQTPAATPSEPGGVTPAPAGTAVAPVDPVSGEPAPVEPAPGDPVGVDPAPDVPGDPVAVDPAPAVPEPSLVTSGNGNYWQLGEVVEGGGSATITVDANSEQATWFGFGGTFNEKGWDALKAVSEAERDRAIRLLFDKNEGCGFTYGRIPIGSSDYGLSRYSLAETPDDFTMQSFSIERDRQDLIPYIKAAMAVKPDIRFWASPWSPPPWMKDNNAFDSGAMRNEPQYLEAHALYLARFVEEYAKENIIVEAVHPQNEPGYPQDYPSCTWTAAQMSDYIANYMGPLFAERLPTTEVWLGTMSNPTSADIVTTVMGNQAARGYVKGIGLQWGMGDGNAPGDYSSNYGVHIMQTEHRCGNYPWESGTDQSRAPNDHTYGLESWGLIRDWIKKGVNSYLAWNMVLDTIGRSLDEVRPWAQNALLVVDRNTGTLIETPTYWVFRHVAQYVDPGSVRVAVQGGDALAWKNPDGSIVTVVHNSGGQASQQVLSVGGTLLQFTVPASGWATVNWQP